MIGIIGIIGKHMHAEKSPISLTCSMQTPSYMHPGRDTQETWSESVQKKNQMDLGFNFRLMSCGL